MLPAHETARDWRGRILEHLRLHGEPLRWAITSADAAPEGGSEVLIEAVMLQHTG
ncbi:hypothetical protein [Synechococcus sp. CS-197]|uniref:hypothetical protein n=1 Tax=Synechococcus sp. CS-197 TaxID=2847985 RepID=UPI00223BECCD|nr:hypothetical protein [Synechococcus sp. CS-197]